MRAGTRTVFRPGSHFQREGQLKEREEDLGSEGRGHDGRPLREGAREDMNLSPELKPGQRCRWALKVDSIPSEWMLFDIQV